MAPADPGSVDVWDDEGGGNPEVWAVTQPEDFRAALDKAIEEWTEHSLRAETGMDPENRARHERDKIHAADVVPRLGWSRPLVDVLRLAQDGRILVGPDGTYRQPGSGTRPGRRVNKQRVDLLLNSGFLAHVDNGADGSALHPTAQGRQGLYLANLYPDGIHPDDSAAYAARLKGARRRWRTSDEAKAIAQRLPAMEKWDLKWSDDRPVRLAQEEHAAATLATVLKASDDLHYVARRRGARAERNRLEEIRELLTQMVTALDQGDFTQASQGVLTAREQAVAYQEAVAHDPGATETAVWVERLQEAADLYMTHWPADDPVIKDRPDTSNSVLQAPLQAQDAHDLSTYTAPAPHTPRAEESAAGAAETQRPPAETAGLGTRSTGPQAEPPVEATDGAVARAQRHSAEPAVAGEPAKDEMPVVRNGDRSPGVVTLPSGSDTPDAPPRQTEESGTRAGAETEFPGELLLAGESVARYDGDQADEVGDYVFSGAHGHEYRLTAVSYAPGEWRIARMPWMWSSSNGGYSWWSSDGPRDLGRALDWIRRDGESRALAAGRWERHGQRLEEPVAWSTTLETEDLEPGTVLVRRFGRSGLLTEYPWGWEHVCSGALPESTRRSPDHRFYAAMWCATHEGLDAIPTERLRILAVDQEHEETCAVSTPYVGKCKKDQLHRFVVDVLAEDGASLGHVVICGKHLMYRLTDDDRFGRDAPMIAHYLSEEKGTWVDWQDRAYDLTGELLLVALAAGETDPKPNVRAALYTEAMAEGDKRAERAARKAAKDAGLRGKQVAAAGVAVLAARRAKYAEIIAAAEAREEAWSEHIQAEIDGEPVEWNDPAPVVDPTSLESFVGDHLQGPSSPPIVADDVLDAAAVPPQQQWTSGSRTPPEEDLSARHATQQTALFDVDSSATGAPLRIDGPGDPLAESAQQTGSDTRSDATPTAPDGTAAMRIDAEGEGQPYPHGQTMAKREGLLVLPSSIDYTPLGEWQVDFEEGWSRPPAVASFADGWYKIPKEEETGENIRAAFGTAADARDRFARSTARDVAALAVADPKERWVWERHHPLAQFDENAAAALERITDPATRAYATQAVVNLRVALEKVGRDATDDYLQRIQSAGSDPQAMDEAWRSSRGPQADVSYNLHARALVITYLRTLIAHADAEGMDHVAIAQVVEDAGGWDGKLRKLGRKKVEYPHFPAAERVAEPARFVARGARHHALGEVDTVYAWLQKRPTWQHVEPRTAGDPGQSTGGPALNTADSRQVADEPPQPPASPLVAAPASETAEVAAPSGDTPPDEGPGLGQEPAASTDADTSPGQEAGHAPVEHKGQDREPFGPANDFATKQVPDGDAPQREEERVTMNEEPEHAELASGETGSGSAAATEAYTYPQEATAAWQRLVDAFAALDRLPDKWPRTSRSHVDLAPVKRAVTRIAGQLPAAPVALADVAHQLREVRSMLDTVRDDLDRSFDDEFKQRLEPALHELLEASDATHDRTQETARQLTRDPKGTWLHPWVTEPPQGLVPVAHAQPTLTPERPGRILQADGTVLRHVGATEDSPERSATAVGAVEAPRGTGLWQVVRFDDGTHETVHPALLYPLDQDPYPCPADVPLHRDIWAARWKAFDRAEAAGETTAPLGAFYMRPGDVVRVPGRKGERTVTRVEHAAKRGRGRRQTIGAVFSHVGPGRGRPVEYIPQDQFAPLPVSLPDDHPWLTPDAFGASQPATAEPTAVPSQEDQKPAPDSAWAALEQASLAPAQVADPGESRSTAFAEQNQDAPDVAVAPAEEPAGPPAPYAQAAASPAPAAAVSADPDAPTQSTDTPAGRRTNRYSTEPDAQPARAEGHQTPDPTRHAAPTARETLALAEPAPYSDAATYVEAHEALLSLLNQHEVWLADNAAATTAANELATVTTLGRSALTALLNLETAVHDAQAHAGRDDDHAELVQRLAHHNRRAQLTMAKHVLNQAANSTSREHLRRLHALAFDGKFIDFPQQTEAGPMELGQYLRHRANKLSQQTTPAVDSSEAAPQRAEEADTMAADEDMHLPVLELPDGAGVMLTAAEAAPHLVARARALLEADPGVTFEFAHVHGRPVYVTHTDPEGAGTDLSDRLLHFGLSTAEDARAVHISAGHLEAADPSLIMAAVAAWMEVEDDGGRPLLDYGPDVATPRQTAPIGPGTAPFAAATEAQTPGMTPTQKEAGPVSTPPDEPAAPDATLVGGPSTNEQPSTAVAEPGVAEQPLSTAVEAADTPAPAPAPPSPAPSEQAEAPVPDDPSTSPLNAEAPDGGEVVHSTRREPAVKPAPAEGAQQQPMDGATAVDRLTYLAREALAGLGVARRQVTATLTAPGHVVVTVETSGDVAQDRDLTQSLRQAVNSAVGQQPDRSLDRFSLDFQHTAQIGQTLLQPDTQTPGPEAPSVRRERLIAINTTAAQIFAERLRNDPHAELARTYLHEGSDAAGIPGRQIPPDVQKQWLLGYAPSDRSAGRWDVLTRELLARGYTEDEILHSGLAKRSSIGSLIDEFDDRVMFPIHDEHGDIVGFGGRRIDRPGETDDQAWGRGGPKYLNTRETAIFTKRDLVFGLHHPAQAQARAESVGPRVSVEGYFDTIAVARASESLPLGERPVAGAPMGTALSERQLVLLRGLDSGNVQYLHVMLRDNDPNGAGQKVLLKSWDLLLRTSGTAEVADPPEAKDAAKLWEDSITTGGDGATPVLAAIEQRQALLDAAVETALLAFADDHERAAHAFGGSLANFNRARAAAATAGRYIREAAEAWTSTPGFTRILEREACTWARRLHESWQIPGALTATAVLLGPGSHDDDRENDAYERALDILAADPAGYFDYDALVRTRRSALFAMEDAPMTPAPSADDPQPAADGSGAGRVPGKWPVGSRPAPAASARIRPLATVPPADRGLPLALTLRSPGPDGGVVELNDRNAAADNLHTALHQRLGQHASEVEQPGRLATPLPLGTVHGVALATSGADQESEDPTVVVWLGPPAADSIRLSHSRLRQMRPAELLAAVEYRAAQAAGLLGEPLSTRWRTALRTILPASLPVHPAPSEFVGLLDTLTEGIADADLPEHTKKRAEQAVAMYTQGHADLALDHVAAPGHIWVLRDDGAWVEENATDGPDPAWEQLLEGFRQEAAILGEVSQEAAALTPGDPSATEPPVAVDLTVAHHSAHEALAVLRPYSIGLPGTVYERITDLVAQMDVDLPAVQRLRGPGGERLMNWAKASVVRVLEGLATIASKIRLTGLSEHLERAVARLRGQDPAGQIAPQAVRADRRMQDLAHIERDLERRMTAPGTALDERGELQERWIVNRARWRARYEQLHGQPVGTDFLPDNGHIAGAPPVPNLLDAHHLLLNRLRRRVAELRDTDPHTGESGNPYDPTADLFNGVAWAYQQRLIGAPPAGEAPEGPIDPAELRQAALTVTAHRSASPLNLRRTLGVSAERADRMLQRLEEQQILGPYRTDAPRTVLARTTDIDTLLAQPPAPIRAGTSVQTRPPAKAKSETSSRQDPDSDALRSWAREQAAMLIAGQQERNKVPPPSPVDGAAPTKRSRPDMRREAQTNAALAAGQATSLAPSQP
ncbi:hypothetical protein ACFU5O_27715 [Streptomyces sp. NPDC057445]|uniref:hypothetical protein n=1 Tax=Streptomyces sp. NPDC057445 TaxID=3346136 RepID=UPI003693FBB1